MIVDLHSHSTASDGSLRPRDVVERAASAGVALFALTDHDTVAGLEEAADTARELGLRFVPGIELSVSWVDRTLHVVGLAIDPTAPALLAGIERLSAQRVERAHCIAQRLQSVGVADALGGARVESGCGQIGRVHFARYLIRAGHARDHADAFRRYLGRGGVGDVAARWAPLAEGIAWIKQAGGTPVLAHPLKYGLTSGALRRVTAAFRDAGGEAIEVVTGGGGPGDVSVAASHARRLSLAGSVGSDFHEPGRRWSELGNLRRLPADITPVWAHWALA